ncbi:MAG: cob(I)yrinic acid a,c-diamide adenosyltransferase [Deltaproteobacteria bacterium]|nr:cob(I)yrinic acid a,c-diamide adenosyltransferase [Deltaproteobacteria bacterium]
MNGQGLIHIYTGDGKGKTTAAIGLAIRAAGQGFKVLFVQFFKEDGASSGEKDIFRSSGIELIRSNCRHPLFTKERTDHQKVKEAIRTTYEAAKKKAVEEGAGLLVLDEAISAINGGWIELEDVLGFLKNKPARLEVVLTGRNASMELVQVADYVTEMLKIKHPYDNGVKARKGIEF